MANSNRFNPIAPIEDAFDQLARGFLVRPLSSLAPRSEMHIKLDVKDRPGAYEVRADIPGVRREDIHVEIDGHHVSLRAEMKAEHEEKDGDRVLYSERGYGMVSREFDLPAELDAQGAKAEYKDGVLNLTLPKKLNPSGKRVDVA